MSKNSPINLHLMGKVVRPHGLEGLLRIKSYAQSEESFLKGGIIFLKSASGEPHEHRVVSVKPHKTIFLMKLMGVNSLEEAEKYRGSAILISKDFLSHKNREEYFFYELIGLKVYLLNKGKYLGTIKHVLSTGSNDIYVVREGEKEVLIPAIHDVVKEVDLTNKKMIVSEVEGLLGLNAV